MPAPNRPLKVFLCHAHADNLVVRALYSRLIKDGVDAWLDREKLLGGTDWEYEIRKAVRESDIVLVCHSKQFNQRGFRQKEVKIALEEADLLPKGEIFIIPVRLEECDVLDDLQRWHWVDLFEDDGYERLIHALRARANNIGVVLQAKKVWSPKALTTRPIQQKTTSVPQTVSRAEHGESKIDIEKPKQRITVKKLFSKTIWVFWSIFVLAAIALTFWMPSLRKPFSGTSTQTKIPAPTHTPAPSKTPTKIYTSTTTPDPTQITDAKGITMRLVPAGEFMMGSESGNDDERPSHQVYLDAFYMDIYEVTNATYKACVETGSCTPPKEISSLTYPNYYGNSQFDEYPVIYVDWIQASAYCAWRGARLPTESEWEKSARGTDGRTYPWGEGINCSQANYYGCGDDVTPVGRYESGKSPYGIYDLAGNVWEWVLDWYSASYYQNSPFENPLGPDLGSDRVLRGGSWIIDEYAVHTVSRFAEFPNFTLHSVGFRCANSAP